MKYQTRCDRLWSNFLERWTNVLHPFCESQPRLVFGCSGIEAFMSLRFDFTFVCCMCVGQFMYISVLSGLEVLLLFPRDREIGEAAVKFEVRVMRF